MSEASMEITHTEYMRLRGKIETAEAALAASQAEVARLREVLAAVVFEASCVECATDRESTGTFRMALDRARAALQGETP